MSENSQRNGGMYITKAWPVFSTQKLLECRQELHRQTEAKHGKLCENIQFLEELVR